MRVTKGDTSAPSSRQAARTRPRHNILLQVGLLALAVALGFIVHQQGWHRPLAGFAVSLARHPASTLAALFGHSDLPTLRVDIRFADYQRLLDRHTEALRLGANLASEQDYVPASLSLGDVALEGAVVAVQMRLPEEPAAALSGEAWPFEVVVQDGTLFELHRFTLAPVDTATLSTWGYLETLRQAGLLAPRYYLVRLVLNGSPQGFYMLEELPTADTLAAQGRVESVVVAFEQSAYWEAYAGLGEALPGSGFQYAQAVCAPYDAIPGAACADAARALRALQPGDWDAERMGTFLALTTLWRGSAALDWRTLRLAYDPITARFEPVGTGASLSPIVPLPEVLLDDSQIQIAYARTLAQYSQPEYLEQLQAALGDDLETLQRDLWTDLGDTEAPWAELEAHQETMRRQIAPSRTLLAAIESTDRSALVLRLTNVQPFPVEISNLDAGEQVLLAIDPAWVDVSDRDLLVDEAGAVVLRAAITSAPRAVHLRVPLDAFPADKDWDWLVAGQIRISTRLYGLAGRGIVVVAQAEPSGEGP